MSSEDRVEHTVNVVVVVLRVVGYVFIYVGLGISYVFGAVHAVMSVTTDSLAAAWWRRPLLFSFTLAAAIATCLVASYICLRGTLRAIVPLLALVVSSGLTIGVTVGLVRMWERAKG